MSASKLILPAALFAGAALFTGCFNDGSGVAGSAADTQAPAAALSASGTWSYTHILGFLPAFSGDQLGYWGFTLDSMITRPVGGYALRQIQSDRTAIIPGGLVDLDITGLEIIWGTSNKGGVFRNATAFNGDGGTWSQITTPDYFPKNGNDFRKIATGSNGSVFMLGKAMVYGSNGGGGHVLYKYSGSGTTSYSWTLIPGGLMDIDVDDNGDLLGVNSIGEVFKRTAAGVWSRLAYDPKWKKIACGYGKYYVLGEARQGGFAIYEWNGTSFVDMNTFQGMTEIQVDYRGRLWGANSSNDIYIYIP
ncbi:MAG: hypothetical protein JWP91_1071 [Fibrobacteres bacterium]|nr:hypothetical protein [Fibrobacterota bacterium]